MYGPFCQLKLKIGNEYDIPIGSGSVHGKHEYFYRKYVFLGSIEAPDEKYWVFKNEEEVVICSPKVNSWYSFESKEHIVDIYWQTIGRGKSLKEIITKIKKFRWSDNEEKVF